MRNFFRLLVCIYLIVLTLLASCNFQSERNEVVLSDTLLTKTITIPNSLLVLNNSQFQTIDSFLHMTKGNKKIFSIVDGTCMKCIVDHLNKIDSVINCLITDTLETQLIFVLNVFKADSAFFMHNMYPAIDAQGIILWDDNYHFERTNNLVTPDVFLRTFMVDENDRIILYGNPLMRPSLLEDYAEKLTPKM